MQESGKVQPGSQNEPCNSDLHRSFQTVDLSESLEIFPPRRNELYQPREHRRVRYNRIVKTVLFRDAVRLTALRFPASTAQ